MIQNKYTAVCEKILEKIQSGVYEDKLPGVHKLAKEFNVTHITASKAVKLLATSGYVNIVGTKGTFINSKPPKRQRSNIICIAGSYNPADSETAHTISQEVEKYGYRTIMLTAAQMEVLHDKKFISNFYVDGFIFVEAALDSTMIHILREENIPFISLNSMPEESGASWIAYDSDKIHTEVLSTFYSLNHRRIAFLGMRNKSDYHQAKFYKCYKNFMRRRKVFDESLFACTCTVKSVRFTHDMEAKRKAIIRKVHELLSLPEPPTAIYTMEMETADVLIEELNKQGVKVPGDISVISNCNEYQYDKNDDFCSVCLTGDSKRAIGAAQQLLKFIKNDDAPYSPVKKWLDLKLVLKKSVKKSVLKRVLTYC